MRPLLAIVALAACLGSSGHSRPRDELYDVVSRPFGIRLGKLTIRNLESILGKGAVVMGGHSNSGRRWNLAGGGHMRADGFTVVGRTWIVDLIQLSGQAGPVASSFPPRVAKRLGILRSLRWRESKREAEAMLGALRHGDSQANVAVAGSTISVKFDARKERATAHYSLNLEFDEHGLSEIDWQEE